MKKIIFEKIYDENNMSTLVDENNIFYVVGSIFDTQVKNLPRKMVEDESLKEYKGIIRKVVLAENEAAFLQQFFNRNHHYIMDLIQILNYEEMRKIIESSTTHHISKIMTFIPSIFIKEKTDYLVFFNVQENSKKEYIRLIYTTEKEKEEFIYVFLDKGMDLLFCESSEIIEQSYNTMNEILKNNTKQNENFLFSEEITTTEDVFDTNSEKTLNRLTAFRYSQDET